MTPAEIRTNKSAFKRWHGGNFETFVEFYHCSRLNDGVPGSKFEREPENYTVEQLKRWLKCRGLKLSGKRSDLIARVKNCLSSGDHHVLDPSIDDGKWFEAKVSREKTGDDVKKQNLRKIPEIPNSGWKKFPAHDIPSCKSCSRFYLPAHALSRPFVLHYYYLKSLHLVQDSSPP